MSTLAFNSYASAYDVDFTHSPIGRLQRKRVFRHLWPMLDKQKQVLEINCGTGYDAIAMAPQVRSVLAADIAPEMIAQGEKKRIGSGISNVTFITADTRQLHHQLRGEYQVLFSDFGGLNCLEHSELSDFSKNIAPFISKQGHLVLVIMGSKCLWEDFFFFKQRDQRLFRRRKAGGVESTIDGVNFKTWYYSPKQIAGIFSDQFKVKKIRPVGLFIPPSYLNSYFESRPKWLKLLGFLENWFGNVSFLSNYADHFLIVLEKKQP